MRLTSIKNKTLKRKGYATVADITLPISTVGTVEIRKTMRKIKSDQNLPMEVKISNEKEKNALKAFGYNVNSKLQVSVNRIDESSKEYQEYEDEMDRINLFLSIAMHVDLSHLVNKDPLWEHLELKDVEDYLGLANWISELGMDKKDQEKMLDTIDVIKRSTSKTYKDWERIVEAEADGE